ncbi:MAG: hypothetical protein UV73_C0001G0133 [Candidatus Gottesmanbacteria bacterium GW2011_GWA2_43_14]|uniref:Glycosyltransferase RgtA/B/C/D-like domain-containing protein n=1 Tax=Candidatus Gottesmanbacteria bacterium GW2011_GWA2_43_14 TaxID=1618443 RepID=A0A0G1DM41_9BACT|nr:MAG: hypothetical protein UV73_C0001G0133 [Candidatus Gottesmanbacteria bacterium GW2011_GWA2_43_14]
MNRRIKLFFYLSLILTLLSWIFIVPIWHFPDEQAHFGQVAFMSQKWRNSEDAEYDLTEEIYLSEQLLGTARDNSGKNRFTFNPEYRIEYTDQLTGKYEEAIRSSGISDYGKKFVHQEAARYPPFYYLGGALVYKIAEGADLFTRVFMVRFLSGIIFLLNIYYIFKIGKLLFPKDMISQLSLAVLSAYQPMMVFANAGVNSDSLGNFLMTLFLYYAGLMLKNGWTYSGILKITGCLLLGIYTKPQFIVMLPLLVILFIFLAVRDLHNKYRIFLMLAAFSLLYLSVVFFTRLDFSTFPLVKEVAENFDLRSFLKFSQEYTLPHSYREVLPWYWGIFNWLGVTYPRIVHRIINRVLFVSIAGFVIYLIAIWRNKKLNSPQVQTLFFYLTAFFIFVLSISVYDWYSWQKSSYVLGIQGRYFLSFIPVQMAVVLTGWGQLFSFRKKLKIWSSYILSLAMIILNYVALITVSASYYSFSDARTFIIQASQYKPFFAKGFLLVFVLFAQFIFITGFLLQYFLVTHEQAQKNK